MTEPVRPTPDHASAVRDEAARIKRLAGDLGFALCRVAEARPSDHADELRDWLAQGRHGEMDWLADRVETRLDPRRLVPGARSVICLADRVPTPPRSPAGGEGRVARYAQISDYHKVVKKRLFGLADALREDWPGHHFRVCVDTAPLLEREHAHRAGLGWRGKHTLLLNRDAGSHLLLGEIVTTLPLPADEAETDHCGSCTRCIDACPTDAITPYAVDARRCISYLTIEHRSAIDPAFHDAMGDWLFGCDVCQDVCPFVQRAERGGRDDRGDAPPNVGPEVAESTPARPAEGGGQADRPPPGYERRPAAFDLATVLDWDESARRAAFVKSAMKRAKLDMVKRNALIAAGNRLRQTPASEPALRARIERLAGDHTEPPLVRETAAAVLDRLKTEGA